MSVASDAEMKYDYKVRNYDHKTINKYRGITKDEFIHRKLEAAPTIFSFMVFSSPDTVINTALPFINEESREKAFPIAVNRGNLDLIRKLAPADCQTSEFNKLIENCFVSDKPHVANELLELQTKEDLETSSLVYRR